MTPSTGTNAGLSFHLFTGKEFALSNNAVPIAGQHDAVLIDTCLVLSDAARLVSMIQATGKNLKAIYVTHAHPDHYFANGAVQKAFPAARICARPGVRFTDIAREMMRRYPDYGLALALWLTRGPGYGLAGAKELGVPPEVLGG